MIAVSVLCGWYVSLDTVDSITPDKVRGLRDLLNSSAMDIMYYNSPLYRDEVRVIHFQKLLEISWECPLLLKTYPLPPPRLPRASHRSWTNFTRSSARGTLNLRKGAAKCPSSLTPLAVSSRMTSWPDGILCTSVCRSIALWRTNWTYTGCPMRRGDF